jgi:type I restriction enzyme M protein
MSIYGQENDQATWALAKMNMILHGVPDSELWRGNTLSTPHFKDSHGVGLKTFDFAVVNPPFSHKSWTSGLDSANDEYGRFEYGIPPPKNGDYAFLLHVIKSLKSGGKGAIILPHGVLFRGNKEAAIRKKLVNKGFIKGIIGLPPNLFYGTGIPACILVIDKEGAAKRESVFFIDASKGFVKDGNKNRLREQDVHRIVDHFKNQIEEGGYSRLVPVSEIQSESNDFNLNITRYIDSIDPEDIHDLEAHLRGGIPNFNIDSLEMYWNEFPSLRGPLFTTSSRAGYSEAAIQANQIAGLINSNQEVASYKDAVNTTLDGWKEAHRSVLNNLNGDNNPKELIESLSEDLLSRFTSDPLLDKYDAYQKIMEYWVETMQDDAYMVVADGWDVCKDSRVAEKGEDAEFTIKIGTKKVKRLGQTIPAPLIIARYFLDEKNHLDQANSDYELAGESIVSFEEDSFDDGDIRELAGKNGKINQTTVKNRVQSLKNNILDSFPEGSLEYQQAKAIAKTTFGTKNWTTGILDDNGDFSDLDKLYEWLCLAKISSRAKSAKTAAEANLMQKVAEQYPKLSEEDCKSLLIDAKWYADIERSIDDEVSRIVQGLSSRVKMIGERYESTLSELENEVEEYSQKVEEHLKKMGLEWW